MNKIICMVILSSLIMTAIAGCGSKDDLPNKTDLSEFSATTDSAGKAKNSTKNNSEKKIMYISGAESVDFSEEGSDDRKATSKLSPGSEVELEQEDISTEYTRVYNRNEDKTGYVESIYLVPDKSSVSSGEAMVVKVANTNLYSGENGSGDVVKTLMQGEELSVLAKTSGGFWKVKASDGSVGYVNRLDIEENGSGSSKESSDNTVTTQTVTTTNDTNSASDTGTSSATPTPAVGSNSDFRKIFSDAADSVGGNWAAAVIELDSGAQTSVNDSKMQAASLIKLYIMGAIYEKYDTYSSQNSQIDSYLYDMITVSDNTAANALVGVLGSGNTDAGKSVVTAYCQTHGYSNSEMGRLLLESTVNGDNYTSVGDCAKFLTAVYNSELPHSEEMLNLLKQQTRTTKIPAGVPDGVQTANKTGELDLVQNDAAIVFADKPYVLCVMAEDVPPGSAVSAIVKLSQDTYNMIE